MSIKKKIRARIIERAVSEKQLLRNRAKFEARRARNGAARVVDYFHDAADPYAHLAVQFLPELERRYDIELRPHLISGPPEAATPERAALDVYARQDARRLATKAGIDAPDAFATPGAERIAAARSRIAAALTGPDFAETARAVGAALWSDGAQPDLPTADPGAAMAEGDEALEKSGHYLGATFHYGGECYWGVDRLHYLEKRLREAGAARPGTPSAAIFDPPDIAIAPPATETASSKTAAVEMYGSLRSPYVYIAFERSRALAKTYGAEFRFFAFLPMVTRGLPVPDAKRIYIMRDAAREAHRLRLPFGRVMDPLGAGIERSFALTPYAQEIGRYDDFCSSFLKGVWADGLDAATDRGLAKIAERAGLDWNEARRRLSDDSWREEAERNRQTLISLGLWGAPTYRVGDTVTWGQDRLWVVEDALVQHATRR